MSNVLAFLPQGHLELFWVGLDTKVEKYTLVAARVQSTRALLVVELMVGSN